MCLAPLVIFRGFAFQQRSNHKKQRLPLNVGVNVDEVTDRGWNVNARVRVRACPGKIFEPRQEDYLSVVVLRSNIVTPTPVGNKALCLLTLAKKIVKTAPLSVLFTSVDWEGYLQGQGDMNNAYHLHLFPLDAAALITSISIWEIVCKDLYLQWWSIRSEGMLTHWETQTNCLPP